MTYINLSNNLNLLMAEARLNANELARRTGIPASSIKKIRNNDNPNPTLTTLEPLAHFFSINISQLIGDIPLKLDHKQLVETSHDFHKQIPIISWDKAVAWPDISDIDHNSVISERQYSKNSFALISNEDITAHITKGTILIIDCEAAPEGRDYALVLKNNHTKPSIKQILIEDDQFFIKSLQVDNLIIAIDRDYKILGTVMECRNYFRSQQ